jgi:hypothetical protein
MFLFEMWFSDVLLPRLKKKQGKKLLIGDRLASLTNRQTGKQIPNTLITSLLN